MEGTAFSPRTPAEVAGRANAVLGDLDQVLWAAKTPEEIVAAVAECEALRSHLAAVEAAALAEVEGRRIAKQQLAWSSTADWFTHTAGTHRRAGTAAVRHAKLLVSERSLTRDALRDGLVSPEQAGIICDAIEELPTNPATRELAEKTLLDEAGRLNATDVTRAAKHLIHVVDPEGTERKAEKDLAAQDRAAHLGRFLAIIEDGAGGVRLRGRGTVEDAAKIKAALLPLTKPTPADRRHRGRRRGLCGHARSCATTGPGCGTRSSRPAGTRWPAISLPTRTARGRGSRSPPASRRSGPRSTGPRSATRLPTTAAS